MWFDHPPCTCSLPHCLLFLVFVAPPPPSGKSMVTLFLVPALPFFSCSLHAPPQPPPLSASSLPFSSLDPSHTCPHHVNVPQNGGRAKGVGHSHSFSVTYCYRNLFLVFSHFFGSRFRSLLSASPKPHPSKPRPCNMPQAKTEVALQFSECCAAETALQHWLFCSAEVIGTKSCAAANEKLHCNIEKAALQESGASCRFPAGFKPPRLGTHVSDLLILVTFFFSFLVTVLPIPSLPTPSCGTMINPSPPAPPILLLLLLFLFHFLLLAPLALPIWTGVNCGVSSLGNGWNTVSRVLFRRRELTEPH